MELETRFTKALQSAVREVQQADATLHGIAERLDAQVGKIDERFAADARQAEAKRLREAAQLTATPILQEISERIDGVLKHEADYTRDAALRRATFTSNPDSEAEGSEALRWMMTAERMHPAELVASVDEAIRHGKLARAVTLQREAAHRARKPGADEADKQVAREIAERMAAIEIPGVKESAEMFRELRRLRSSAENRFGRLFGRNPIVGLPTLGRRAA